MTNPYSLSAQNGSNSQQFFQTQQQIYPQNYYSQNNSLIRPALACAGLGFAGGTLVAAGVDYFKNRKPINSNNEVSENFAKQVLNKIIKKDYVFKGKEFFNQKLNILRNIDGIKTPEKFKKLMEKNRKFCSTIYNGLSIDTVCKTVTKENLKDKISAIKKQVESSLSVEIQNIKDTVKLCWDKENKKFVKPKNIDNKLFDIIKNTKNDIQWLKAFKYGGITAGILGALTLGYSIYSRKNQ